MKMLAASLSCCCSTCTVWWCACVELAAAAAVGIKVGGPLQCQQGPAQWDTCTLTRLLLAQCHYAL